jgi:hypothetical protein
MVAETQAPKPKPSDIDRSVEAVKRIDRMSKMKAYFAEQPRETIHIRKELGDQTARINGYGFRVQAGERVKVPVDVAEIFREGDII